MPSTRSVTEVLLVVDKARRPSSFRLTTARKSIGVASLNSTDEMRKAPSGFNNNDVVSSSINSHRSSTFDDNASRHCYHHHRASSSSPLSRATLLSHQNETGTAAADTSGLISLDPPPAGQALNSAQQQVIDDHDGLSSYSSGFGIVDSHHLPNESTTTSRIFSNHHHHRGHHQLLNDLLRAWILQTRDGRSIASAVSSSSGAENGDSEEAVSCVSGRARIGGGTCKLCSFAYGGCAFFTVLDAVERAAC